MKTSKGWKQFERTLLVLLVLLLFALTGPLRLKSGGGEQSRVTALRTGWYQLSDGGRKEIQLPIRVEVSGEGSVELWNDSLRPEDAGKVLSVGGVQYGPEVWLGETQLYRYEDNAFPKNDQMKGKLWADITLPEETGTEPLRVIYTQPDAGELIIEAPELGSRQEITGRHLQKVSVSLVIVVCMQCLGVISLCIYLYMRRQGIREERFLDVSLFLLVCGFWCLTDSGIYQMYGKNTALGSVLSFYAFMLMSVPMLHFVRNTLKKESGVVVNLWITALYLNALLQGVLHKTYGIPFIRMLVVTHLLLFSGVLCMIFLLWREYRSEKNQQSGLCLYAFSMLGISGVIALVLYWAFRIYWYEAVFQFGILLYIALMFWGLICKVAEDIRFRMEQRICERMSTEDRLTGMKNRKAFEKYLQDCVRDVEGVKDAELIFIQMEDLLEFNDTYGMSVGDEGVIGTAGCVKRAGTLAGEQVKCFRVSGNEFAAIIPGQNDGASVYEKLLVQEVCRYNSMVTGRERLNLSCGSSSLRKPDGSRRTVSDWMACANQKLQKNRDNMRGGRRDDV